MSALSPDYLPFGIARQTLLPGLSTPTRRAFARTGRRIRRACLYFETPAWRPSHRAYSAGLRRRPRDARHRVPLHPKVQEVRHFSSRHRTRLSVAVAPRPGARRSADWFVAASIPRGATRPFSPRFATDGYCGLHTWGARHTPNFHPVCYAHCQAWLIHLFNQRLAAPAECSRPTGFGGPPLLPGYPDLLRPAPAFTGAEIGR
jgi:hypothetical protein